MPQILIELPDLLQQVIEADESVSGAQLTVDAKTLHAALQQIRETHPKLATHLFNEQEQFREHVLCFLNGKNLRWMDDEDVDLAEGDRLLIMQAVSGG